MKISHLQENLTPSSSPSATIPGPKFGRSDEVLESGTGSSASTTTAGVIATGTGEQRKGKKSIFKGIETSKPYANSRKAGISEDAINEDDLSEENLLAKQRQEEFRFKRSADRGIGKKPMSRDIMAKEEFNGGGEYNDEVDMVKNNLHTIVRVSVGLAKELQSNENMPEWVQEKIAVAKSMMVTVMDYMVSQHERGNVYTQDMDESKPDFGKMFAKKIGKHNKAVVQTNQEIGTRVADVGAGGKEYNVKTDKEYDKQKGLAEGSLEANTPNPVVVVQDLKGKILDKINLSMAVQKYKLGNPQDIKNQLAHQNYTQIGNYIVVSPMSGQPQDATTQSLAEVEEEEDKYYFRVRHQTKQDIELEMSPNGWDSVGPAYATYEEAQAALKALQEKHPNERFTYTQHPRISNMGGTPHRVFPEGVTEEWSQKYKSSINCSHPKGFSQKAHCAGKKKHNESVDTQVMEMTCEDCGMCQTHGDNTKDNLDEACWKGYHKEGNKKMFGKTYPNCVKNESEEVAEEKKPNFMKAGNMKPVKASGEEIPGAVHALEKLLLKAKERDIKLNYTNIDKIMQAVCKKHNLTGDELHNEFVDKHHMIPDNWIVKQLDEACWDTHKQVGMKNKGGKQVPNCVPKESIEEEKCPHCSGPMFNEMIMNEKKDACYYKVKSRYKVWPSAYASGALVKCRNKGASNWGNSGKKNESIEEITSQLEESLHDWFNKEKWVRMDTKGNIKGACAREPGEGKPKCLPAAKAHSLGKKGRASAAARKRREDPNPERSGSAINVNTKKKSNEGVVEHNGVKHRYQMTHPDDTEMNFTATDDADAKRQAKAHHAKSLRKFKDGAYTDKVTESSQKRCMQCGMENCKCPGDSCKCKPIEGWIPNKGFRKAMAEGALRKLTK